MTATILTDTETVIVTRAGVARSLVSSSERVVVRDGMRERVNIDVETVVVAEGAPADLDDFSGIGTRGLVPDPGSGTSNRVLRSDGTWGAQSGGGGGASDAVDVTFTPAGDIAATDVQAAIEELDAEKAALAHTHPISDIVDLQDELDGKSDVGHGHAIADVTGLQSALDGKAAASHGHAIADVSGLQTALDGKAATVHTHATSDVTGLDAALAAKLEAPVANVSLADMATATLKGRVTAGTGEPEDLSAAQARTLLNVADGANAYVHPNHSGDVTSAADGAQTIADDVVTNAKLANVAERTVKGRSASGAGDPSDIALADLSDLLGSDATLRFGTNQSFTAATFALLKDWDDTRLDPDWITYDSGRGDFTVVRTCSIVLSLQMSIVLNAAGTATFQIEVAEEVAPLTYSRLNDFLVTHLCVSTTDATPCAMVVAWTAQAGDVFVLRARRSAGSAQIDTKLAWSWLTLEASLRP